MQQRGAQRLGGRVDERDRGIHQANGLGGSPVHAGALAARASSVARSTVCETVRLRNEVPELERAPMAARGLGERADALGLAARAHGGGQRARPVSGPQPVMRDLGRDRGGVAAREVGSSLDAAVTLNRLDGNADNLIVFGNHNRVAANVVSDTAGCDGGCGYNISVEGGTGNQVIANLVLGGAHDGIRLDTFAPDDLPLSDAVVRADVVRGAAVDGVSVGTETDNPIPGARVEANRATANADDGLDVRRAGTLLQANAANRNGDLGIDAIAGVVDGGGNRAAGNGNPAQCAGVSCG